MTTKSTESTADRSLVLTRVFNAPRHLVFEAWTQKQHLERWALPHNFTVPWSDGDPRVGGAFRICMVAPDGGEHRVRSVYREIIQDELLVFTHGWEQDSGEVQHETLVTVRFTDEPGGKTKIFFEQTNFKSTVSRDLHNDGWTEGFDNLDTLLAKEQE